MHRCDSAFYTSGVGVEEDTTEATREMVPKGHRAVPKGRRTGGRRDAMATRWFYEFGFGVRQDKAEAENGTKSHRAVPKGRRSGRRQGTTLPGFSLRIRTGGVEQDKAEAVKWFKAAEQGNAEAQCLLGICYEHGDGVEQDKAEAVKWFQKAAEQGNFAAQQRLRKIEEAENK